MKANDPSKKRKGGIGSNFEDFLKEEDIFEEVQAEAISCVQAWLESQDLSFPR